MKKLLVIMSIAWTTSSFAATVIAQKQFWAGFSPRPVNSRISILSDGTAIAEIESLRENKTRTIKLAKLSAGTLKGVKARIEAVTAEELKDYEEGKPKCTDAPSKAYRIFKADGTEVPVYRWASCHEWVMTTSENADTAQRLKALLDGMESLIEYNFGF